MYYLFFNNKSKDNKNFNKKINLLLIKINKIISFLYIYNLNSIIKL